MKMLTMILTACALSATLDAQVPDFTPPTPLIGALLHNDAAEAKRLLLEGGPFQTRAVSPDCWRSSVRIWNSSG